MQLKGQKILALYSDTSLQEVEVALVLTDGLDVLKVEIHLIALIHTN